MRLGWRTAGELVTLLTDALTKTRKAVDALGGDLPADPDDKVQYVRDLSKEIAEHAADMKEIGAALRKLTE